MESERRTPDSGKSSHSCSCLNRVDATVWTLPTRRAKREVYLIVVLHEVSSGMTLRHCRVGTGLCDAEPVGFTILLAPTIPWNCESTSPSTNPRGAACNVGPNLPP